jgi:hypothetical protein
MRLEAPLGRLAFWPEVSENEMSMDFLELAAGFLEGNRSSLSRPRLVRMPVKRSAPMRR